MKLTRCLILLAVVVSMVTLSGCLGYMEYLERSGKPNINMYNQTRYDVSDARTLGMVKADTEVICVLGLYIGGHDGSGVLFEKAAEKYGEKCNGIKDISSHSEILAVLPPIFAKIRTTYIGMAVEGK